MNTIIFFICLIVLITLFVARKKITEYLFEEHDIHIGSEIIVYIVSILFVTLILIGMLFDGTKERYSDISQNYDKLRPKVDNKPHRYFDIDFDSLFPKH